jgi:uncharacterized protein YjiS (DUF1127 family)
MAGLATTSLINSQPLAARPWGDGRRSRERRALARLTERELADFGASTADVYRELSTPVWRVLPPC